MDNRFGLHKEDMETLVSVIEKQPGVEEAFIFGSRAKGNYRKGSDVDIALKGKGISRDTASQISYLLNEETQMPYHFDVLASGLIRNTELTDHINRLGVMFYKRGGIPQ